MAGKLKLYSTTPGNNNSAPPDGWPEGMAPSAVNNAARQMMAQLAEWYRDAEWIDYGSTVVTAAGQVYTISGDVTAQYTVGRAIRQNASNASRGVITASSYSAPNTSVTVNGYVPSAAPTSVELGIGDKAIARLSAGTSEIGFPAYNGNVTVKVNGTTIGTYSSTGLAMTQGVSFGSSVAASNSDLTRHLALFSTTYGFGVTGNRLNYVAPAAASHVWLGATTDVMTLTGGGILTLTNALNTAAGANVASASTINLDTATGNVVNITGTTTINLVTLTNGRQRVALAVSGFTLTNGVSLKVLPGLMTQAVQAGDMIAFEAISGVVYARIFRSVGGSFMVPGTFSTADTTITIPTGTWRKVKLHVRNLKANSDFWLGARVNGDSAANYNNSIVAWSGTASAINGGALINAMILNQADPSAIVAIDTSSVTTNPANGVIEILNPNESDHSDLTSVFQYRSGDAASYIRSNGACRHIANGPVTSISLHLRTAYTNGVGLSGSNVTPTVGFYDLELTA